MPAAVTLSADRPSRVTGTVSHLVLCLLGGSSGQPSVCVLVSRGLACRESIYDVDIWALYSYTCTCWPISTV